MQDGSDVDVGRNKDRALDDRAIVCCSDDDPATIAPGCGTRVSID